MSTNVPEHKPEDQEIDLADISNKIAGLFQNFNTFLFRCIQFFIKNRIVIAVLLLIGFGSGFYLDINNKTYDHQVVVTPNFKSTDYLYSKIDLINSKIIEGDTIFIKDSIGLKDPKTLKGIKIEPITDVYKFIEDKAGNFELIKLMAQDGDIKKILEDNLTSKNYTNHEIVINTNRLISNEFIIQPILNFLNQSSYFHKVQIEELKNAQIELSQNDTIISQIDAILNGFSNSMNRNQQSDKLVYYNENTQLNDVIKTKEEVILQQGILRVDLIGMDKIIKKNSLTLNKVHNSLIGGKLKLVLPIVLILFFILSSLFVNFYKKQSRKLKLMD
jgi:hypothetical protein